RAGAAVWAHARGAGRHRWSGDAAGNAGTHRIASTVPLLAVAAWAAPLLAPAAGGIALNERVRHSVAVIATDDEHRLGVRCGASEREHVSAFDSLLGALRPIVVGKIETFVAAAAVTLGDDERSLLERPRLLVDVPNEIGDDALDPRAS